MKASNDANHDKDNKNLEKEKNTNSDNLEVDNTNTELETIQDFEEYYFKDDGDVEFDEDLKKKFEQKQQTENKYSKETDKIIKKPLESPTSIKKNVFYISKKGIEMNLEKKKVKFLGEGTVMQDDTVFKAGSIIFDYNKKNLKGTGVKVKNTYYAPPVIQQKKSYYLARLALYNTKSEKAYVQNVITPQKEGILVAKKVKKDTDKIFYAEDIQFSTCRLENPHFSVNAKKAKIYKEDRAITGPFYLKFAKFASPIGFFYSVFRITEKRESGFIAPDLGFNPVKGVYIDDFGYFFAPNENIGFSIMTCFNSEEGNLTFKTPFEYCKKHRYNGEFNYEFKMEQFRDIHKMSWNHNSETRPWGKITIQANAKIEQNEPQYKSKVKERDEDNKTSADLNYNCDHLLCSPYNLTLNLHHSKKFGRKIDPRLKPNHLKTLKERESELDRTKIIFPYITLQTDDVYIFSSLNKYNIHDIFTNINFSHKVEYKYEQSRIIEFDVFLSDLMYDLISTSNQGKLEPGLHDTKLHNGFMHTIPISTNFPILRHFKVNPQFAWKDRWYFYKLKYKYDNNLKKIVSYDYDNEFHRVWEYNIGTNIQTSLEFRHRFSSEHYIRAFRHEVTPVLGINFSPGFGNDKSDYFQRVFNYYTGKVEKKYKYDDLFGNPEIDPKGVLSITIKNRLEFKIRDSEDYQKDKLVKLFESFDIGTGYNFLADKYKLQSLTLNTSSSFLDNKINLKSNLEIDPYVYSKIHGEMEKIDDFAWNHSNFLGEVRKAGFSAEFTFKEKEDKKSKPLSTNYRKYVDFDIPWNMRISYNIAYHKPSPTEAKEKKLEQNRLKKFVDKNIVFTDDKSNITTHNIHIDGDLKLTKHWKLNLSVLYNIKQKKFEQPKIAILRDLHCWEMKLEWSPFSYTSSVDFVIKVKANALKLIKYRSRGKM